MVKMPRLNQKNLVERKNLTLHDAKFDADTGTFQGYASVFNVKDLQNDVVLPGAFRKTIADNDGLFVLLDQHDIKQEIGLVRAKEDEKGLLIEGEFYVDQQADPAKELRAAREAYIKMQRRQAAGKPLQFSIGYRAINPRFEKGSRLLGEIGLAEVSTVTFPALPEAVTTSVKSADLKGFAEQYQAALERRMPFVALDTAMMYFWDAADDAMFSEDGESALEQLQADLNDFSAAILQAVAMAHGMTDAEKADLKQEIQNRKAAISDTLDPSTEDEEPSDGHSDPEAAEDEGKAAELAEHLKTLKAGIRRTEPSRLSEAIRQKAQRIRENLATERK